MFAMLRLSRCRTRRNGSTDDDGHMPHAPSPPEVLLVLSSPSHLYSQPIFGLVGVHPSRSHPYPTHLCTRMMLQSRCPPAEGDGASSFNQPAATLAGAYASSTHDSLSLQSDERSSHHSTNTRQPYVSRALWILFRLIMLVCATGSHEVTGPISVFKAASCRIESTSKSQVHRWISRALLLAVQRVSPLPRERRSRSLPTGRALS
jgi:hypothetical protein